MKELIIYFSRADENYFGGKLKYIDKGNTEIAAEKLSAITGADMFEIEPVTPYSKDYNTCIAEAKKDQQADARPAVRAIPDISGYDLITLMFPNYWGTMPMHLFTALEQLDFTGKTVRAVCTNEGSGMGRSESDIKKLCKGASFGKSLSINGSSVNSCDKKLEDWSR